MTEKTSRRLYEDPRSLFFKMIDIFYNMERSTDWLVFLTTFVFFFSLEQSKRSGRKQTTAMSSIINKKVSANFVSYFKHLAQGSHS